MAVYIVPIPFIYLGSIFLHQFNGSYMVAYFGPTISLNALVGEFLFIIISMLVFAFYMYPRNGEYKGTRLLRIVVTAAMLLAMNGHIFIWWVYSGICESNSTYGISNLSRQSTCILYTRITGIYVYYRICINW